MATKMQRATESQRKWERCYWEERTIMIQNEKIFEQDIQRDVDFIDKVISLKNYVHFGDILYIQPITKFLRSLRCNKVFLFDRGLPDEIAFRYFWKIGSKKEMYAYNYKAIFENSRA